MISFSFALILVSMCKPTRKRIFFQILYYSTFFKYNIRIYNKNSGEKSIPREQPNQKERMKITTSVLLSLFMRDNEKCNVSHAP